MSLRVDLRDPDVKRRWLCRQKLSARWEDQVVRILAAFCLTLVLGTGACAECRAPRFRGGRDFVNPESGRGSLYVSIAPSDTTFNKLICLAQTLRENHSNWKDVSVLVFSSRDAAENFLPAPVEVQRAWWARWARQLHAAYFLDSDKHEEYLEIMPLGFEEESSFARVELPLAARPRCHLNLQNRCLMAVAQEIVYPQQALHAKVTGQIVLTGKINRDGKVTGVRVAGADVHPTKEKNLLANAALQNLRAWQFDAGQRDDPMQIKYSYAMVPSSDSGNQPTAQFELPSEVEIWGRVPE
jgi:TonB family protein